MDLNSLFSNRQKNPEGLLRLYVATAIISVAIIVLLNGFSFFKVFSGFVINSAIQDSVRICHLLSEHQRVLLLKHVPGQGVQLAIDKQHMSQLDQTMRTVLEPFNITKIKIYDAAHRIIYSTESSLIGLADTENPRLRKALAGTADAQLVPREKARDRADEALMNVDVVETYVPILSTDIMAPAFNERNSIASPAVMGSFEIYVNVTKYRDQIRNGVAVMTTITAAVLAIVFGFSYLLIRRRTLQLKDVQARLQVLSITDGLTGVANRRYVMKRGEEEFTRAERNQEKGAEASTLCCIMLDIDHFKNVNDTKGHPAGDAVLRELVERLRRSVRPYDIVGRYGGEEFLVLLPDTVFDEAVLVAERIRTDIRGEPFTICGENITICVSLGIAGYDTHDQNLDDLLKRADEGLYKAKHAGRDRVEWVYNSWERELDSIGLEKMAAC